MLYEEIYSYGEVVVKNTTEKEMTYTGQYNTVVVENTPRKKFSKKNCTAELVSKATSEDKFSKKNYRVMYYNRGECTPAQRRQLS